ncbi:MAG: pyrroline-5-carboxylate reductase [Gammaproteobacteria bacterium]|nr:pyrroline-5-carboxylate reductase [Gammaproteobacteria bacterium]MBU1555357.1 pyrroline-5-carboxylate reductase [Gammaproteobacteria bacterium]MBU2069861.1 pyrroline-5-carboxylate reductase [Gammaproteobacteria bacterium]MBU2184857.1 pyrroline-5-carboxylate reductase [Gammaproteobacteria bacterium]MBU2204393.1 pyrroline-5-carboxylate reductase [Gammaproteobacteria bacterium]
MTTQMNDNTVAFIGAGNMARCVIAAMVNAGYPADNIIAANRSQPKLTALAADFGIQTTLDNIEAVTKADVIVLAVKPQMMQDVCQSLIAAAPEIAEKLFVTLAAGLPVSRYQQWLGQVRLVRAMPNTPSLVGLGVTGLFPSGCSNYEKAFVDHMFSGTGLNVWLETEAQINHIIAVTGSSPAYFFFFMQAMQQVAEQLGFDAAQAKQMVAQTALGAATMALNSEHSFADLRAQVTSKGGTTHEAVTTFANQGLEKMVADAMYAAIARAEEMAQSL